MNKKTKVYLGWTSTGQREDIQLYQFHDWKERYGEHVELVLPEVCVHQMFHDAARNSVVEDFLATDCDILWFLDSDISPPPHVLDLVVHHQDKWLVAGAPYPLWMPTPGTGEFSILFTAYKGVLDGTQRGIHMTEVPESGTDWVDGLATGCLFIKREVFAKLEKPYFAFKFDHQTRRIQEGEDLGFALKLHDLGIKFFVDYGMVCRHFKRVNLLDMNNYAISVGNHRLKEYDKSVRPSLEAAYKAAFEAGVKRGREEAKAELPSIPKTKSGLILPSHLRT